MTGGIGSTDIDIDIDIDIGTGGPVGTAGSSGPATVIGPIGVSPALTKQPNEDWFRGNKWPPTDLPFVFQNRPLTKKAAAAHSFPLPPWTPQFYSIAVIGQLVQASIPPEGGAGALTWDSIDLDPILAAANVDNEIAELIELIEYRPAVFSEARRQADGVIGYFRGVLSFTELSHPWTFGLATVALRVGALHAIQ
jgi:hypothetical protein